YFAIFAVLLFQKLALLTSQVGRESVLAHLLFIDNLFQHGSPIISILWAPQVALQLYLLFPLLATLMLNPRTRYLTLVAALLITAFWHYFAFSLAQKLFPVADTQALTAYTDAIGRQILPGRLDQFVIGILAGIIFVRLK